MDDTEGMMDDTEGMMDDTEGMMDDTISYAGLTTAEVLAGLYNGTGALGLGVLHDLSAPMTVERAQAIFDDARTRTVGRLERGRLRVDYVGGRPIKVVFDLEHQLLERVGLYDRDAGEGMCQRVIDALRRAKGLP